jgi:HAD superfamily hydrolase (TIGR01490 family)
METERVGLAVFDFDGTCIGGQSGALFSTYLFKRGYVSPKNAGKLAWWAFRYLFHLPHEQNTAREAVFGGLGGLNATQVNAIMRAFHDEVLLKRYRPRAEEEVRRCKQEGLMTILVSATFIGIARPAAEHLGVDALLATEMEKTPEGNFTGYVQGEVIAGPVKRSAVAAWADDHIGPGKWYIARAYGDHHTDQYLLGAAHEPVAVCPGRTLRKLAKQEGWRIVDWSV